MAQIKVYPYLSPRIIEVLAPDTEITVQELVNLCRDWEDDDANMSFEYLISAAGKEDLGGSVTVGITATLNNAQIYFEERSTPIDDGAGRTCDATDTDGRQLYVDDATFVTDGIERGDIVYNATTGAMATVIEVVDENTINHLQLSGGSSIEWTLGDNYRVYENVQCSISGGNLVSIDENGGSISSVFQSPNVQVVRTSSSSATLSNQDTLEFSSYSGGVTIDEANLSGNALSGTVLFPAGTLKQPVRDTFSLGNILTNEGLNKIYVIGNLTLDTSHSWIRHEFIGESDNKSTITIPDAVDVTNCEFSGFTVAGTLDGNSVLERCTVGNLDYVDGSMFQCTLAPTATITLAPNTIANLQQCFSGQPGVGSPTIDLSGNGSLSLRDYNGGIKLTNCNTAVSHSIDMASGQVKLDPATITAGTFVCRGVGKLINADTGEHIKTGTWNGGVTILNEMINQVTIAEASSFSDAVYIDVAGVSGTTNPIGLEREPVNNIDDALLIAQERGTSKLIFLSDFTIASTDVIAGYQFYGTGYQNQTLTFESGCIVAFCDAHHLTLTGFETGLTGITDCYINSLGSVGLAPSSVTVVVRDSIIGGTITFPANYSGEVAVINCHAENSVVTYPHLDMGNSTANVLISNWNGQLEIENVNQNNEIDIRIDSGEIELSSTVTSANIHIVGTGFLSDTLGNELPTGVWNGAVTIENETITGSGGNVWTTTEKNNALAWSKKASDNAEEANLKL